VDHENDTRTAADRVELDFERDPQVLALIGGALGQGVFTVDADGLVVAWSAGAEHLTGCPRREVVGRSLDVLAGNGCEGFGEFARLLRAEGARAETGFDGRVLRLRTRHGERRVLASARVLFDGAGRAYGGLALMSDLVGALGGDHEDDASGPDGLPGFVGRSQVMRQAFRKLRLAAQSDVTTLVTGESGTGKELAARAIHTLSARAERPFVALNCSALPEALLESELFGHVKGAFTGAVADRQGLFETANGGTLFLDEIGEVSPLLQVKLLRVLQEREVTPVGSSEVRRVDVRIVTATHTDLAAGIEDGSIREDFYYRIGVFEVRLPPLRDRASDIPLLARHFLAQTCAQHGRPLVEFDQDALAALVRYAWPGNARELRNAIEHALVLAQDGRIALGDLPPRVSGAVEVAAGGAGLTADEEAERIAILEALDATGWNRTRAAQELGISRVTLWKRIRRYRIDEGVFGRGPRTPRG